MSTMVSERPVVPPWGWALTAAAFVMISASVMWSMSSTPTNRVGIESSHYVNPNGEPPPQAPAQTSYAAAPAPTAPAPQRPVTPRPSGGIASVTVASGVPVNIKPAVSLPALASFFRHFATLVRSGMPVYQALNEMQTAVHNSKLRNVLPRMQETAQSGHKLSGAMANYPGIFPVHAIASIYAGELAGKLDTALEEIASDLEEESATTRMGRIGWGMMKINWITFIIMLPACSITDLLLPVLKQSLASAGNMSKEQVLREIMSTYIHDMLPRALLISAAMIVLWIVWGFIKRVPAARRMLDGALLYVPLWGPYHRDRAISRFAHVLDGLYSAGISPGTAWDAASLTVRNSAIAEKLRLVRSRVGPTAGLAETMAASGVFPSNDVALAASGEKAGQVPQVLANMSRSYAERAAAVKVLGRTVAIGLLIFFCLVLGGYVMVKATQSYFDLAFKAGDMMGK